MTNSSDPDLPSCSKTIGEIYKERFKTATNEEIVFSPAHESDLPYLSKIYMQAYLGMEEYGEPSLEQAFGYLSKLQGICPYSFFKAEVNGKVAGFMVCDPKWKDLSRRNVIEIHELVVGPAWQGCGLGKKFMHFAAELGLKLGKQFISLWAGEGNTKAINWYTSKFGFRKVRREGKWVHFVRKLDP